MLKTNGRAMKLNLKLDDWIDKNIDDLFFKHKKCREEPKCYHTRMKQYRARQKFDTDLRKAAHDIVIKRKEKIRETNVNDLKFKFSKEFTYQ